MIDEKPPIGAEEVAEATAILQKYKAGKAALDNALWTTSCGSGWDTGRTARTP